MGVSVGLDGSRASCSECQTSQEWRLTRDGVGAGCVVGFVTSFRFVSGRSLQTLVAVTAQVLYSCLCILWHTATYTCSQVSDLQLFMFPSAQYCHLSADSKQHLLLHSNFLDWSYVLGTTHLTRRGQVWVAGRFLK